MISAKAAAKHHTRSGTTSLSTGWGMAAVSASRPQVPRRCLDVGPRDLNLERAGQWCPQTSISGLEN